MFATVPVKRVLPNPIQSRPVRLRIGFKLRHAKRPRRFRQVRKPLSSVEFIHRPAGHDATGRVSCFDSFHINSRNVNFHSLAPTDLTNVCTPGTRGNFHRFYGAQLQPQLLFRLSDNRNTMTGSIRYWLPLG